MLIKNCSPFNFTSANPSILKSFSSSYSVEARTLPVLSIRPHLLFNPTFINLSPKKSTLSYSIGITISFASLTRPHLLFSFTKANPFER